MATVKVQYKNGKTAEAQCTWGTKEYNEKVWQHMFGHDFEVISIDGVPVNPAAPNKEVAKSNVTKLSKTMQKVLDRAKNAGWYYKDAVTGKTFRFSEKGRVRDIGHEGFAITDGGYIYGSMSSATLSALEKRGLIEVREDGGSELDFFKLVNHEIPERLSTAIVVKVTCNNKKTGEKSTENVYMATPEDIKAIEEKFHETDYHTYEFEIIGNAELTVWKRF